MKNIEITANQSVVGVDIVSVMMDFKICGLISLNRAKFTWAYNWILSSKYGSTLWNIRQTDSFVAYAFCFQIFQVEQLILLKMKLALLVFQTT